MNTFFLSDVKYKQKVKMLKATFMVSSDFDSLSTRYNNSLKLGADFISKAGDS